jgi:hypothetical protein
VIALLPRNGSARCADDKPQTVSKTRREQLDTFNALTAPVSLDFPWNKRTKPCSPLEAKRTR